MFPNPVHPLIMRILIQTKLVTPAFLAKLRLQTAVSSTGKIVRDMLALTG